MPVEIDAAPRNGVDALAYAAFSKDPDKLGAEERSTKVLNEGLRLHGCREGKSAPTFSSVLRHKATYLDVGLNSLPYKKARRCAFIRILRKF